MCWSYYTHIYIDCRPSILLSDLRHVKHFKAVYSVKTETNANLSRIRWLNCWHRCNHKCKRRLVYEIAALPLKFSHSTVYAHIGIGCDRLTLSMCAMFDNTAITLDLMVI